MTADAPREVVAPRDQAVIAGELGRQPRDLTGIAARCPFGYPAVIETAPIMTGGAPNPTLLYITCPSLATAVSRVEAGGGVRRLKAACRTDEQLRDVLLTITELYRARRAALVGETASPPGPRLGAGIGGPEGPETAACLHAYAAALLAVMTGWLGGTSLGDAAGRARAPEPERPEPEKPVLVERVEEVWARFLPPVGESWCHDSRCSRWDTGRRPAAIDVGTISVRLLVADIVDDRPQTLVRRAEVTRLGEGLRPGGLLLEDAKRRTAEVVKRYASEARVGGADSIVLAATSAARNAVDGEEFIDDLGRDNGIEAVVLPGETEAELAFTGASLDVEGDPVVLDIGGGSTEVMRRLENGEVRAVSLEIGASRATERWLRSDPPTPREIANVYQEAQWAFKRIGFTFSAGGSLMPAAAETADEAAKRRLVGVAGTVTTLACLDAGLQEYDAEVLHLRTLTLEGVRTLVEHLGSLTVKERAALPCMQRGRAPVIVGGAVILLAAMETLGYEELTVSERDLLDGLVLRGASDRSRTGPTVLT